MKTYKDSAKKDAHAVAVEIAIEVGEGLTGMSRSILFKIYNVLYFITYDVSCQIVRIFAYNLHIVAPNDSVVLSSDVVRRVIAASHDYTPYSSQTVAYAAVSTQ